MPPEPLPWDRKDFFKDRKHERSESLGSAGRWRDSSHHGSREFNRWGPADFRRPTGHGKQGGWHLFSEESGHGYTLSRSSDKMLEDESCRPSVSRGDVRYGRSSRENRGSFSQREWRAHSWEINNGSPNISRRLPDVNNEQRSVDDLQTYPSRPHSDFLTWEQHHLKHQHDRIGAVNGLGTSQRCDRVNSLGSVDWKPLKWTRSGSLSSRGSGFSHSSSSRSIGGVDSNEAKAELQPKNATPVQSPSGDAAACVTSAAPSEETTSRKKPRLGWGEGLAKYEKKKVEGPDVGANKDEPVICVSNAEPCHSFGSGLVDQCPKVTGFSDCASPATPSSVACSSSPGVDDKLFGKTPSVDNDAINLTSSPGPGSQNHLETFTFNLEMLDIDCMASMGSPIMELLQSDDPGSVDSSSVRPSAMNKLLILKADISKVLEVTESEIDSLENELKTLKSGPGGSCPYPAALSSFPMENDSKSCEEHAVESNMISRPTPLHVVSSGDKSSEKMLISTDNLHNIHENGKDEDIDSPGTATSKFVEPLPLAKAVSSCDEAKHGIRSGELDAVQSTGMELKCLVPCTNREEATASDCGDGNMFIEVKDRLALFSSTSICANAGDILFDTIIASNKESANRASEVLNKLLQWDCCKIPTLGYTKDSCCQNDALIREKFAARKRFLRFKERVITLKFKSFNHLWKEDARLHSVRKCRPKSHKKLEVSLRTSSLYRKHRSSLRSRFSFPAGNRSLVPTSEIIHFTSKLLSDPQVKPHRDNLKMPAMILDRNEKKVSRFISNNGLVEDPLAFEKERAMINPWTLDEKEIFLNKLAAYGKDFRKIASFLDHKTTADCVEFYYKNHKSDCFEKIKKQDASKEGKSCSAKTNLVASGKKWNHGMNAASLEILSAASAMAGHADGIGGSHQKMRSRRFLLGGYGNRKMSKGIEGTFERSNSIDPVGDERETVAADVLAGICGSLSSEAMSSCITSSVDPAEGFRDWKCLKVSSVVKQPLTPDVTQNVDDATCSDESCGEMDPSDWTDDEKSAFLQAVSSYGNDFEMISQSIRTRSRDQCKVFFSKARKCFGLDFMFHRPQNVESPVSDDANGGGSDTGNACIIETGSAVGTDKSGTRMDEDMLLSVVNTYHDKSDAEEARSLLTDFNRSKEVNGKGEVIRENAEDMNNLVSDACHMMVSGSKEIGIDKMNELANVTAKSVSDGEVMEPGMSNSVLAVQSKLVSEVAYEGLGNEPEGQDLSLCENGVDNKCVVDASGLIESKCSAQDSSMTGTASQLAVDSSCSGFSLDKPHVIKLPTEKSLVSANSVLQDNAVFQSEKVVCQDRLSSTLDFQESGDRQCHTSIRNDDHQQLSGHPLVDHGEHLNVIRGYSLQRPVKREVKGDMSCSTSVAELPLLSQKIERASDNMRTHSRCSSDSDKTCKNGDVKLFGKILTNPSSVQKPNPYTHGNEKNGSHHPKSNNKCSSLKFSGHQNMDGNSTLLKFDHNNYLGLENVPMRSYGFWDGNKIQTGFSSLPDSALLLAKYPAAFGNYPTSSTKLEQQPFQVVAKSTEQHLNGISACTTREINSGSGVVDCQLYRSRDSPRVQPFTVDMKHRQDIFSDMQRRNGFESISSLQQQGRAMVGMNGVGRPSILVGGSCSGVSDPVAAIKMHYANTDQYGGQTRALLREDEPWVGKGNIDRCLQYRSSFVFVVFDGIQK
ncbi:Nuclear receptor corepressor 1 [Quillaja saponaria]|uniref:Nuclear receptor corepressor 1 n=1 Tax=Quillaja saponaria TaxID=32244 RepID=A0AAD7Q582_QUISA|nr:Nuclear receptor corepressor 1 [Quillaja saponaria]